MTKRKIAKRNKTQIKRKSKKSIKTRKYKRINLTKKRIGGDTTLPAVPDLSDVALEQKKKTLFRRSLNNLIIEILDRDSNNKIKETVKKFLKLFKDNDMINTLIPVSSNGKHVDKESGKAPIVDFVSPVTLILNNLTGQSKISDQDIIRILDYYYEAGGNFNNISSKYKTTPLKYAIDNGNVDAVRILLDKSNKFHVFEDGLDEDTKTKLAELIPREQKIKSEETQTLEETQTVEEAQTAEENRTLEEPIVYPSLQLPSPLPEDNDMGYDRRVVPEFWKPIFKDENELLRLRDSFMEIYSVDRYTDKHNNKYEICKILERIVPGYLTIGNVGSLKSVKALVNVNIINCMITLLYSIVLYRLYETQQDYLFIFKGGRALQLSLVGIPDIGKYFSEDTDVLIVPNKAKHIEYDLVKMQNLSENIGYLVKWFFPEEINIVVSLPTNPKNTNKEITKVLYNDEKIFKPVSDIGFGELNEDIKKYFESLSYSPFFISEFETECLFITPTIEDMLAEKLFYYAKYLTLDENLKKEKENELLQKQVLENPDEAEKVQNKYGPLLNDSDRLLLKFTRAIIKLVEAITKTSYIGTEDFDKKEAATFILRNILSHFEDYTTEEREKIVSKILRYI